MEWDVIIESGNIINSFYELDKFKILELLFPEIKKMPEDVYYKTINILDIFSSDVFLKISKKYIKKELSIQKEILWSCIFMNLGSNNLQNYEQISLGLAMDIMKRFGFTREVKENISWIISNTNSIIEDFLNSNKVEQKKIVLNENFLKSLIILIAEVIINLKEEEDICKELEKRYLYIFNLL